MNMASGVNNPKTKVELLAPAGNPEKLEIAVHYGADAVYLGGKAFSLRNYAGNFSLGEMRRAIAVAHERNVRVYVACNSYIRNSDRDALAEYLDALGAVGPDALIVADPAVLATARRVAPQTPIHLSTQANVTSIDSVLFWQKQGVQRINAARELSLDEIREIAAACPVEIEAFVHGAMCISYSGRCLLSGFLTGRESNRGECAHPCRWGYAVVEETRPGKYMPIAEDNLGSYIFNSKDLCMIEHLPLMIAAGIRSFKIEGRMKGINYLASVVKTYREAIDACYADAWSDAPMSAWRRELAGISHRPYCTGFYFGDPDQTLPYYEDHKPRHGWDLIGKVTERIGDKRHRLDARHRFHRGEAVEILSPTGLPVRDVITGIFDLEGKALDAAHGGMVVDIDLHEAVCKSYDLIRRVATAG